MSQQIHNFYNNEQMRKEVIGYMTHIADELAVELIKNKEDIKGFNYVYEVIEKTLVKMKRDTQ